MDLDGWVSRKCPALWSGLTRHCPRCFLLCPRHLEKGTEATCEGFVKNFLSTVKAPETSVGPSQLLLPVAFL